ncbi:hypothetical protein [Streptomyces sp. NPDC050485]|uniref:hypothetical protein n=1 Tax=Streptomyces sp. NPDC050485 TaxID=3365617 RepID=UPI003792312D
MASYVTDLTVLEGEDSAPPPGWHKIDRNLNEGTSGVALYFALKRGEKTDALTDIIFLIGKDAAIATPYTRIPVDLNKGAGGAYIYTAFGRDPSLASPITDLDVLIGDASWDQPGPGWWRVDQDLNQGAHGAYVYLTYRQG